MQKATRILHYSAARNSENSEGLNKRTNARATSSNKRRPDEVFLATPNWKKATAVFMVSRGSREPKEASKRGNYYFILRASALLKGPFIASVKDESSPHNIRESLVPELYWWMQEGLQGTRVLFE